MTAEVLAGILGPGAPYLWTLEDDRMVEVWSVFSVSRYLYP